MKKSGWAKAALILANIGAINWGLATLDFNVVNLIVGSWPVVESIIYYLVAICGIYGLIKIFK
jgi:uncharacterized membrane protein YuzA (DUF378 family)